MGYLSGLQEYLDKAYHASIFDHAFESKKPWEFHVHTHRIIKGKILENLTYDIKLGNELLPKTNVKLLYPEDLSKSVMPLMKLDKKIRGLSLEPIIAPKDRYHIKNKSLFPLMKEKKVVFFTLLEGEIFRGIIAGFGRYEITVSVKEEIPITVMRHSICDLRDKKGRCFLKSFQEEQRDWEKTSLFVSSAPDKP